MKTVWLRSTIGLTGALLLGAAGSVLAQETEPNHCTGTSKFAEDACVREVRADYFNAYAICRNLPTSAERIPCREDADDEREEGLQTGEESCKAQRAARDEACALFGEDRYDPDFDPANFVNPDDIGTSVAANPYLSLVPGVTQVIRAGEGGAEWVLQYVTEEVEEIDGVLCRTVLDLEFAPPPVDEPEAKGLDRTSSIIVDGVELDLVEHTDDWYAQDVDGNVWYCGELSREYEDGMLASLDGSFRAGDDGDKAGILVLANPAVGDAHRQEWSVNNAEDYFEVVSTAGGPEVEVEGFECNDGCVVTREKTALEPTAEELKYWLAETGFVLAEDADPEGEREELECLGASLAECVTDPDILDELCRIAPDVFCPVEAP